MKKIFPLLAIILVASCKPVERLVEKTVIEVKIDTIERLVPVEINVPVHLTGDTIIRYSEKIVLRDPEAIKVDPVFAWGKFAWSKASVIENRLFNELHEVDTTIYAKYDSLLTVYDIARNRQETTSKVETKIITKNSAFAKFCIKFFFGVIIIIGLYVFCRIRWPTMLK